MIIRHKFIDGFSKRRTLYASSDRSKAKTLEVELASCSWVTGLRLLNTCVYSEKIDPSGQPCQDF